MKTLHNAHYIISLATERGFCVRTLFLNQLVETKNLFEETVLLSGKKCYY